MHPNKREEGFEFQYETDFLKNKGFSEKQITEIQAGLVLGLDVSIYTDRRYDQDQMYQIRRGLEEGVDVKMYLDPRYPFNCMSDIRSRLYLKNKSDTVTR